MISPLAPRILNLPDDIRAALARVDGPGWLLYADRVSQRKPDPWIDVAVGTVAGLDHYMFPRKAFWSANPAASVAAVLYPPGSPLHAYGLYHAHELLRVRLADNNDDHAAALSIIEAHVANRGTNV